MGNFYDGQPREKKGELVPFKAVGCSLGSDIAQKCSQSAQYSVAVEMAMFIVDEFELVDIDEG